MSIPYVVRKKVDKTGEMPRELYYAVAKSVQRKVTDEKTMAEELAAQSSLSAGDVMSVLTQLPERIAFHLKLGQPVTIHGLGTFYLAVSSTGAETPEECSVHNIKGLRICFKADPKMKSNMHGCKFHRVDHEPTNKKK